MRVGEWEFWDREHPVYQRPPEASKWAFALPGMVARKYDEKEGKPGEEPVVVEPLALSMEGYPSVDLYQTPSGQTIQKVSLRTNYGPDIDAGEIEAIAAGWNAMLKSMSMGPYTLRMLRRMGHPYGYGVPGAKYTWSKLTTPRIKPFMRGHVTRMGLRAGTPDHAIINHQTGALEGAFWVRILRWYGGINILFGNPSRAAWWLAHGTYKMQAHGPWEFVARAMLPNLHASWRKAAYQAWRKAARRAQAERAAMEGQFGEGATAPTIQAEAGGWE